MSTLLRHWLVRLLGVTVKFTNVTRLHRSGVKCAVGSLWEEARPGPVQKAAFPLKTGAHRVVMKMTKDGLKSISLSPSVTMTL